MARRKGEGLGSGARVARKTQRLFCEGHKKRRRTVCHDCCAIGRYHLCTHVCASVRSERAYDCMVYGHGCPYGAWVYEIMGVRLYGRMAYRWGPVKYTAYALQHPAGRPVPYRRTIEAAAEKKVGWAVAVGLLVRMYRGGSPTRGSVFNPAPCEALNRLQIVSTRPLQLVLNRM